MTDPVQLLIDAGAIPQQAFDESSRYRSVGIALLPQPAGAPPLPYVKRRFIAQPSRIAIAAEVTIHAGDRPDNLAARTLGDPLLYWRIADANAVADAAELTATVGARVRIPG
jgi:nucleoid-associated protein YgaU